MSRMQRSSRGESKSSNGKSSHVLNSPGSTRLPNTTAYVPIVYGSIAFFLSNNNNNKPKTTTNTVDEGHTHRWTLYVRGPNGEDLSVAIAKVVFHLHPSFPQPVRELTTPPFEVTERGWGEFEATIRIVWHDDVRERATVLTHFIKLYPALPVATTTNTTADKGPVVHEFYDEIVFTDPTENFYKQLQRWSVSLPKIKSLEEAVQDNFPTYDDEEDFTTLMEAQRFLDTELVKVKDRIIKADAQGRELEAEIKLQQEHGHTHTTVTPTKGGGPASKKSKTGT